MPVSRMDQFGYYRVGPYKFYSKFDASVLCKQSGNKLEWNFNDDIYSAYDWTVEPSESLDELYRARAQQLRDQYDYLVLWFSGGADSTNVLNSFINNDIKLDEVASYVNYSATSDKFNFLNGEIYNVAIPKIQEIKNKQPDIEHTIIDLAKLTIDFFSNNDAKFDWIYQINFHVNPNASARHDIKLSVAKWRNLINSGKRVGFIHGIDKPSVTGINNRFFYRFVDRVDNAVSPLMQMQNRPWEFDEFFYWSPAAPKIPIKQSHVIKKFLKGCTETTPGITEQNTGVVSTTINKKIYWVTSEKISSLIYPGWYPVPYQGKPRSMVFTPRDTWFFKLPDSDPAKHAWKIGLEHRWASTPDCLKNDPAKLEHGFKNSTSKHYNLGGI